MAYENAAVIISGGSKGIGLSIAKVFARKTSRRIVLIARNYEDLKSAQKEVLEAGAKSVEIFAVDLTDQNALETIDFESLNAGILVNNAGSYLYKPLAETSTLEFNQQFKVNALSAFHLTQKLLPLFHKLDRALVLNISSQAAMAGFADSGAYAMSKHAMLGYTRSLRKELMHTNIAVSAINLGQTYSTSWEEVDVDSQKLIDPEDVGKLILSLSELSVRSVAEEITLQPQGGQINPM